MRTRLDTVTLVGFFSLLFCAWAIGAEPDVHVLGRGGDRFEVGAVLHQEKFENLDQWVVQVHELKGVPEAKVEVKEGVLDCMIPGRGCTIWFKKKLKTRTAITYEVVCPEPKEGVPGLAVKDVNHFWLATDPKDSKEGLFDSERYNGEFTSYNKMKGYYASSGGGRNTTTRMRRYPREREGRLVEHIALKERDDDKEFLLTPGKVMKVQLVAFDDLIQYIVDGELVYEMSFGDEVAVEKFRKGRRRDDFDDYDDDEFPFYKEGFFGFRMVGTHHRYSKFQVHELVAIEPKTRERTEVTISSLDELCEVIGKSYQNVKMKPGTYVLDSSVAGLNLEESSVRSRAALSFRGSHNVFDFTGVTFEVPIAVLSKMAKQRRRRGPSSYSITGNHVTLKGGNFVNTYPQELEGEIDFGTYNQNSENYPAKTAIEMYIGGDDVHLEGCEMTVRGSSPYGYGNMYGIGGGNVVPLRKHSGILIHGDRVVLDGCKVKMEAFGHAIFAQYGNNIVIKNCYVEGEVRSSNDFLEETVEGSFAKKYDHKIQWPDEVKGLRVPKDHMINLVEDGIRAYDGARRMTVENCKVVRMRGGIKLYMADEGVIRNCEVLDCVVQGFSVPSRGVIENCRGNAAYGPLLYIHMDSHHSQKIEIEVLPAPHGIGDHPLAAIRGREHEITLTAANDKEAQLERPIIVGYPMRFDYLSVDYPEVPEGMDDLLEKFGPERFKAERIELSNETKHPVVIGEYAEKNRVESLGEVRDLGERNRVHQLEEE